MGPVSSSDGVEAPLLLHPARASAATAAVRTGRAGLRRIIVPFVGSDDRGHGTFDQRHGDDIERLRVRGPTSG